MTNGRDLLVGQNLAVMNTPAPAPPQAVSNWHGSNLTVTSYEFPPLQTSIVPLRDLEESKSENGIFVADQLLASSGGVIEISLSFACPVVTCFECKTLSHECSRASHRLIQLLFVSRSPVRLSVGKQKIPPAAGRFAGSSCNRLFASGKSC